MLEQVFFSLRKSVFSFSTRILRARTKVLELGQVFFRFGTSAFSYRTSVLKFKDKCFQL